MYSASTSKMLKVAPSVHNKTVLKRFSHGLHTMKTLIVKVKTWS